MPRPSLSDCFKAAVSMDDRTPSPSAEIHDTFLAYSVKGFMDVVHFHKFLAAVQKESNVSEVQAKIIMESWLTSSTTQEPAAVQFSEEQFMEYLFDTKRNFAINAHIHHDMKRPLSHYFVFTGHNSYLTGNQLSSSSSEKPIVEALRRGVRVVELDLWPNSDKDDISVVHGRTLTSPVPFEKCLLAIRDNAFVKSPYPVVVTLEDHLSPELQRKAAKKIADIFGKALFYPETGEGLKEFPSPESLKERIIISTKPPKEYLGPKSAKVEEGKLLVNEVKEQSSVWGQEISDHSQSHLSKGTGEIDEEESSDEEDILPEGRPGESPEYKKIITIRQARKPKGKPLIDALTVDEHAKRVSLSEPQLSKIVEKNPTSVIRFTHKNFLRIYPYGWRIDSSNYNPVEAWAHGAQMVAVNMQGYGRHLWVAQGFFKANGGCGYVEKPYFLLPECQGPCLSVFDPITPMHVKQTLKVKVCKGRGWREQFGKRKFDTFSAPDFYTRVGIAGVTADTVMKKTATMDDKWTPEWGDEFEFGLRVPELAVLRLEVHEDDKTGRDDFAGQTCLPVSELKSGYRMVPLNDEKGDELQYVRLLLHFQIK